MENNPFLKRATELYRDEEAFLAIVSPEPLSVYLVEHGKSGGLYDRLVLLQGTPGSGKTTLARLFEYTTLASLLRNSGIEAHRQLVLALTNCGALASAAPRILGCRLPLESDYRELWEFGYSNELKIGLMQALIQARAVLAWLGNLGRAGITPDRVSITPKLGAIGALEAIGGPGGQGLLDRARSVELALYRVVAALIPPAPEDLPHEATYAYRPFDVIDAFVIEVPEDAGTEQSLLQPLLILDDAHALHPLQFDGLYRWLARRELRIARWILSRLDLLPPGVALAAMTNDKDAHVDLPGLTMARDVVTIMIQGRGGEGRFERRKSFRAVARDMSSRYLAQMQPFSSRGHKNLSDLLLTELPQLPPYKHRKLRDEITSDADRLSLSPRKREEIERLVEAFRPDDSNISEDLRLAMVRVVMHRYAKRHPQLSLFDEPGALVEKRPIEVDSGILDAAWLHLAHHYELPFYYGMDDVCDAASENAERFLQLAAVLVDASVAQMIRSGRPALAPQRQHALLKDRAARIMANWAFPNCQTVRRLVGQIAELCVRESLAPNAWLDAGANAYGIAQADIEAIPSRTPELAHILKYALAYNFIQLVPRYQCQGECWCLIELGGVAAIHYGLTLKRGGFIKGNVRELAAMIEAPAE